MTVWSKGQHAVLATAVLTTMVIGATRTTYAAETPITHYTLDAPKSTLDYQFVQADAQNKGRFRNFAVTLDFSPDNLAASKLDVIVQMASVDTGDKERDDTLKSADLFSVDKFPQAHFTSSQITKTANGYEAIGKLTLRGVTREMHVPFSWKNANEAGGPTGYLTGKTTLKRLDFGVGQGDWKSTEWVGNDVPVSYSLVLH